MKFMLFFTALVVTTSCYPSNLQEAIASLSSNKQSAEIKTEWTDEQKESLARTLVNINDKHYQYTKDMKRCDPKLIENYFATLGNDPIAGRKNSFILGNFCSSIKEQVAENADFEFSLIAQASHAASDATFPHYDWSNSKEQGYRIFLPIVGPGTLIAEDMPTEQNIICKKKFENSLTDATYQTKEYNDYPIQWKEISQSSATLGTIGNSPNALFHGAPITKEARFFAIITFTKLKETKN